MIINRFLILLSMLLAAAGCSRGISNLRNGDLVFVGIPLDYEVEGGSMDAAISSATGTEGGLNLIHVADRKSVV